MYSPHLEHIISGLLLPHEVHSLTLISTGYFDRVENAASLMERLDDPVFSSGKGSEPLASSSFLQPSQVYPVLLQHAQEIWALCGCQTVLKCTPQGLQVPIL